MSRERPHPRLVGAFTLALCSACVLAGATVIDASLSPNAFDPPLGTPVLVRQLMPEGWAFFTRDPQEAHISVMAETETGWVSAEPGANAEPSRIFGFDRSARAHGLEKGLLYQQVAKQPFGDCREDLPRCIAALDEVAVIDNPTPDPGLCGTLAFVRRKPVPWAWSRSNPNLVMPSSVAKVEVRC